MLMDFETSAPSTVRKCCRCSCNCTLINGGSVTWQRAVKRKFDDFQDGFQNALSGFDQSSVARLEIEDECSALQQTIQELYTELEEERNASSSAANEAMSMILRLQREKAEIHMEARQFKRFVEEKMAHDQHELLALEDLLYKREQIIQTLICEMQAYKKRVLSFRLTEAEAQVEKSAHGQNPNMVDNVEYQFKFLPDDEYPALRCKMSDADLETYAFGETPRSFVDETPRYYGDTPHTLEHWQSSNHLDGEFRGSRNIYEREILPP